MSLFLALKQPLIVFVAFIAVTAHTVTEKGLQSVILDFDRAPPPHDGKTIGGMISDVITVFQLRPKILSITTDNASANVSSFDWIR